MALSRCFEKHSPPMGRNGNVYVDFAFPVGYPDTALVCGRPGCSHSGLVWMNKEELAAFNNGAAIFQGPNNFAQMKVLHQPIRKKFQMALDKELVAAPKGGLGFAEINAGNLHRIIGGYPGSNNRMPVCCAVMRATMKNGDAILHEPPKKNGASLTVRYKLPR